MPSLPTLSHVASIWGLEGLMPSITASFMATPIAVGPQQPQLPTAVDEGPNCAAAVDAARAATARADAAIASVI